MPIKNSKSKTQHPKKSPQPRHMRIPEITLQVEKKWGPVRVRLMDSCDITLESFSFSTEMTV